MLGGRSRYPVRRRKSPWVFLPICYAGAPTFARPNVSLPLRAPQIGIAKADLFPRFALFGTISVAAQDFEDLFRGDSFENFGGPSFRWAILNYGRIQNNIRVQDARFPGAHW